MYFIININVNNLSLISRYWILINILFKNTIYVIEKGITLFDYIISSGGFFMKKKGIIGLIITASLLTFGSSVFAAGPKQTAKQEKGKVTWEANLSTGGTGDVSAQHYVFVFGETEMYKPTWGTVASYGSTTAGQSIEIIGASNYLYQDESLKNLSSDVQYGKNVSTATTSAISSNTWSDFYSSSHHSATHDGDVQVGWSSDDSVL